MTSTNFFNISFSGLTSATDDVNLAIFLLSINKLYALCNDCNLKSYHYDMNNQTNVHILLKYNHVNCVNLFSICIISCGPNAHKITITQNRTMILNYINLYPLDIEYISKIVITYSMILILVFIYNNIHLYHIIPIYKQSNK